MGSREAGAPCCQEKQEDTEEMVRCRQDAPEAQCLVTAVPAKQKEWIKEVISRDGGWGFSKTDEELIPWIDNPKQNT